MRKTLFKILTFIICVIISFFLFTKAPVISKNENIIRDPKDPFIQIPMVTIPKAVVEG